MRSSSRKNRASLAGALVALALGTTASVAAAQGAPPAQALRDRARQAQATGDMVRACQLFEQSFLTARAVGGLSPDDVLFELADCHEHLGKKPEAANEFHEVMIGGGPRAQEARERLVALTTPGPEGGSSFPGVPVEGGAPPPTSVETVTGGPPPTRLGDFMDTRLAWTFGDDDVLHATGLAYPISQSLNIGDRPQYRLFFDALNTRFTGRENMTHLGLYKKLPGFIKNLDTEASVVVRFDLSQLGASVSNQNVSQTILLDAGSFIRLFYHTNGDADGKVGLGLTLWPVDADRMRLGYLYDTSWGGSAWYINQSIFPGSTGLAPGAKLQYDGEGWNVFFGFKTASIVQLEQTLAPSTGTLEQLQEQQTNVGLLAGGGVDITPILRVDVNGGYFQQGKFSLPDVLGQRVFTFGGSARVLLHHRDMPVPQSIDFLLYRNDPNKPMIIFKPEVYTPGKTTWQVVAEGDFLWQNLKDFDVAGATKLQGAHAGSLQANLKSGYFRGSLTGILRDLPYVLRNQPSFIPFETMPRYSNTRPEVFVAAAADYYFPAPRLTPGLGLGVQTPATFETVESNTSSAPISRTVVVRQQGDLGILPANTGATPIIEARASLKWDISPMLSAIVWVQYKRDNNATFVERDPSEGTVSLRTFLKPDFLGLASSVQARF